MILLRPVPMARAICLTCMLAACTTPTQDHRSATCVAGQGTPQLAYELFFGRSITGHREVSDATWNDFLAQVITPNLPDGYTIFDGTGHWRNPATGQAVQERTKVLLAALPDSPAGAAAIARIRQAYATQFSQTLVGMTVMPVCGAF